MYRSIKKKGVKKKDNKAIQNSYVIKFLPVDSELFNRMKTTVYSHHNGNIVKFEYKSSHCFFFLCFVLDSSSFQVEVRAHHSQLSWIGVPEGEGQISSLAFFFRFF